MAIQRGLEEGQGLHGPESQESRSDGVESSYAGRGHVSEGHDQCVAGIDTPTPGVCCRGSGWQVGGGRGDTTASREANIESGRGSRECGGDRRAGLDLNGGKESAPQAELLGGKY